MVEGAKIVFLDRDGVINEYPGDRNYVNNWSEFKFIPGSIEGIRKLNRNGFKTFIISNQAGVAKELFSRQDLERINKNMLKQLKKKGAYLSGVYYCTHRSDENCSCRKPKTRLLEKAVSGLGEKIGATFFIGDSFYDMKAASNFGAKSILVLSGKEKISNRSNWEFEPNYIFDNLLVAADFLCSRYE